MGVQSCRVPPSRPSISDRTEFFVLVALLTLLSWATSVLAQTQRGQIVGEVTDPSGSVVPGAKIELMNPQTGGRVATETNSSGLYTIPYLQYGK